MVSHRWSYLSSSAHNDIFNVAEFPVGRGSLFVPAAYLCIGDIGFSPYLVLVGLWGTWLLLSDAGIGFGGGSPQRLPLLYNLSILWSDLVPGNGVGIAPA